MPPLPRQIERQPAMCLQPKVQNCRLKQRETIQLIALPALHSSSARLLPTPFNLKMQLPNRRLAPPRARQKARTLSRLCDSIASTKPIIIISKIANIITSIYQVRIRKRAPKRSRSHSMILRDTGLLFDERVCFMGETGRNRRDAE